MERIVTKQMRFGKSCVKCKSYFVSDDEDVRLCPWCSKVESGRSPVETLEYPEI